MAYTKQLWQNGPNSPTPLSASRLTYMENGIAAAATTADTAAAAANGKVTYSDLALQTDPLRSHIFGAAGRTRSPFLRVRLAANVTNFPVNALTIVPAVNWSAPTIDTDGKWSGNAYTIPVTGWYNLQFNANFYNNALARFTCYFMINGTAVANILAKENGDERAQAGANLHLNRTVRLNQNDVIRLGIDTDVANSNLWVTMYGASMETDVVIRWVPYT